MYLDILIIFFKENNKPTSFVKMYSNNNYT